MNRFCLLAALCVLSTASFCQFKVVTIGSSTTAGVGATGPDSAWVGRFTSYFKTQLGIVTEVTNLGVAGYTVYAGMPTSYHAPAGKPVPSPWNNVTAAVDKLRGMPDPNNGVIIVNYPTNGFADMTVTEVMKCFRTIYDSATRLGNRCFITTTQPRSSAAGGFNNSAVKKKLAEIKDSILLQFGDHSINFWDGMFNPADTTIKAAFHSGDSTHFNNAGHRVLFQRVQARNVLGLVLPVKLQDFNASLKDNKVVLKWAAEKESPDGDFSVQRSENGTDFETLKKVNLSPASGLCQYSFTDESPLPGTDYYRLAIREHGEVSYSKVLAVKTEITGWVLKKMYPVPAEKFLQLELVAAKKEPVTIDVINGSGVTLQQYNRMIAVGNNRFSLPVQQLSGGIYFLRIHVGSDAPVIKTFSK